MPGIMMSLKTRSKNSSSIMRNALLGIRRQPNRITELLDECRCHLGDVGVVLNQKDACVSALGIRVFYGGGPSQFRRIGARQADRYARTLADFAIDVDRSARLMGKAVDLREAEAGPFAGIFRREERIENLRQHVCWDAFAIVDDADADELALQLLVELAVWRGDVLGGDHYHAAGLHRIAGVEYEIHDRKI